MDVITLVKAVAHGEELQIGGDPKWLAVSCREAAEHWLENTEEVRVKPTLTPVDMSVLVASGIDCEFSDSLFEGVPLIGSLTADCGDHYVSDCGQEWGAFRPRMDHWHSLRNLAERDGWIPGTTDAVHALRCAGFDVDQSSDGQHLRFNGAQDGRCYPWESDQ